MKKTFYIGLCLTLLTLLCQGCQKEPLNSDIEGHWQLLEFTTKADGVVHPCERIYYSIQLWVVEVAEKEGPLQVSPFPRTLPVRCLHPDHPDDGDEHLRHSREHPSGRSLGVAGLRSEQRQHHVQSAGIRQEIHDTRIRLRHSEVQKVLGIPQIKSKENNKNPVPPVGDTGFFLIFVIDSFFIKGKYDHF